MAALHGRVFTVPRPWSEAEIASLVTSPLVFTLSEGAGFLIGRVVAGEAELLTLAVAPEARRQGMARRLVGGFLAEAQARGAEQAFLDVAADNDAAIALYLGAGFRQAGRRRDYFAHPGGAATDALVMVRAVAAALPA